MKPRLVLWLIIVLTFLCLWINLPLLSNLPGFLAQTQGLGGKFPLKLGLDLQGGIELTLQTKMEKIDPGSRDKALEAAKEVIERRVNLYGVSEATVQSAKFADERRILVALPGVKDLEAAISLVGKTAQLEFREMIASPSGQSTASAQLNPLAITQSIGLIGADLEKSSVGFSSSGKNSGPEVEIVFTSSGAKKFAEVTKRNVGKPLAIFLDNQPIIWPPPIVQQEIIGGSAVITGHFTVEEAKNLSIQLNAGALPMPIKILEQRQIGASLGKESIEKSLVAGGLGIITVLIFMAAYYGIYGLVADTALLIYTLLALAIFRTGLFLLPPITLTLAGIAGFILSIGMAVDANILTFERMKEELRSGKAGKLALEAAFKRAWTSIRDSNISSLITASILYAFGTSIVRGFALTLALGVLTSMFSAVFVTRTFLRNLPRFQK